MTRLLRWFKHHFSRVLSPSERGACATRAREGTREEGDKSVEEVKQEIYVELENYLSDNLIGTVSVESAMESVVAMAHARGYELVNLRFSVGGTTIEADYARPVEIELERVPE